jgi:beta-fructofuranosidase
VSFDLEKRELRCGDKAGIVPRGEEPMVKLRILVDRSVVEVYADGREVMSLRMTPAADATEIRLVARQAPVGLVRVQAWPMKSIW